MFVAYPALEAARRNRIVHMRYRFNEIATDKHKAIRITSTDDLLLGNTTQLQCLLAGRLMLRQDP